MKSFRFDRLDRNELVSLGCSQRLIREIEKRVDVWVRTEWPHKKQRTSKRELARFRKALAGVGEAMDKASDELHTLCIEELAPEGCHWYVVHLGIERLHEATIKWEESLPRTNIETRGRKRDARYDWLNAEVAYLLRRDGTRLTKARGGKLARTLNVVWRNLPDYSPPEDSLPALRRAILTLKAARETIASNLTKR